LPVEWSKGTLQYDGQTAVTPTLSLFTTHCSLPRGKVANDWMMLLCYTEQWCTQISGAVHSLNISCLVSGFHLALW